MSNVLRCYVRAVCEGMQGPMPWDLTVVYGPGLEFSGADFMVVATTGRSR